MSRILSSRILLPSLAVLSLLSGTLPPAKAAPLPPQNVQMGGPAPVTPWERLLSSTAAMPYFSVTEKNDILEGAIFDKEENLYFCNATQKSVMRLTPDKKLTTILKLDDAAPCGIALHKDGRLFIAAIDSDDHEGTIIATHTDGSYLETIVPTAAGYMPKDLCFDSKGGIYFADSRGSATSPEGGVYYIGLGHVITPVIQGLSVANGIALSKDGQTLYVTEFAKNCLHRIQLSDEDSVAPFGSTIPYYFTGSAPDGLRMDEKGNLYVALVKQGRVMVMNADGFPVGQILLPGREKGRNLLTTSLALRPGGREAPELYIMASNVGTEGGAGIFRVKAPNVDSLSFSEYRSPTLAR